MPNININDKVKVSISGMVTEATYIGFDAKYNLPKVRLANGRVVLRKTLDDGSPSTEKAEVLGPQLPSIEEQRQQLIKKFGVNERFAFIEQMTDMVIKQQSYGLVITGSGGLGKTHTVLDRLVKAGLKEDHDYVMIKGTTTPKALYRTLYENATKIVVFDDCDSVFDTETSVNILKAALDTYKIRKIKWLSERTAFNSDLPLEFSFEGGIIFVSNLSHEDFEQTIISRSHYVNLDMTREEKMTRIESIAKEVLPEVPMKLKDECLEVIKEILYAVKDLNIRTFIKVVQIRLDNKKNWKDLAIYTSINGK